MPNARQMDRLFEGQLPETFLVGTANSPKPLLRIHPKVDVNALDPRTSEQMQVGDVWIPGCRVMVEARSDSSRYFTDLPVGFATRCRSTIDVQTSKTFNLNGHTEWYSRQLSEGFQDPADDAIVPVAQVFASHQKIVILNCMDDLYGHCLLKLLNAQYLLESHPELGLCVLIPRQLKALVPAGVAEIWEVDIPLSAGVRWYPGVALWVRNRLHNYQTAYVSAAYCQLPNRYVDIRFFTGDLAKPAACAGRNPVIVFHSRADRLWGTSVRHQNCRLRKLYDQLKWRFENLMFVVTGFGTAQQTSGTDWLDLRVERLDGNTEQMWFQWMAHADTAIGVHGSNMLIPSGLARNTVELLPQFKYPMLCTDLLYPPEMSDPRDAIQSRAILYGDDQLLEISPERVAKVVANQLTHVPANREWFSLAPDHNRSAKLDSLLSDRGWLGKFQKDKGRGKFASLGCRLRRLLLRVAAWLE